MTFHPKNLFFDTETTKLLPRRGEANGDESNPRIVQLGALLTAGEGPEARDVALFHCLIRPEGWEIPAESTAIHGITTEMCQLYGILLVDAISIFHEMAYIANKLVAHNYEFDSCVIDIELRRLGQQPWLYNDGRKFCTMLACKDVVAIKAQNSRGSYNKYPKLTEAHQFFLGRDFDGVHTAIGDVKACQAVYHAMLPDLAKIKEAAGGSNW